jgi:hypothetical protein
VADPIMMAVASALAGKAAEAAVESGKSAWASLMRLVRTRFARDEAATVALRALEAQPQDPVRVRELALALERINASDAEFRGQLHTLWQSASVELAAQEGGVVNSVSGTVEGHLLQARDVRVEGGLHLGSGA